MAENTEEGRESFSDRNERLKKESLARQKATRERRKREKELRDRYKYARRQLENSGVYSTKKVRELKEAYENAVKDLDTSLDGNKDDKNDTVQNDSIDSTNSDDIRDTIEVILCVDGEAYEAQILGTIGAAL